MDATGGDHIRDNFLKALSNYSECIKPYLRTAQDRYVAGYYIVEGQKFDFNEYCKHERAAATEASTKLKATME